MQVHFPGLKPPMICSENLPVLEVPGKFPGNSAFHELTNGVHCEDAVSIQLVVLFPWSGNRSQEAACPVFGNIAFVEAFLVNSVDLSPILFYQVLDILFCLSCCLFELLGFGIYCSFESWVWV